MARRAARAAATETASTYPCVDVRSTGASVTTGS
jgi:hypothetical protein